MIYYVNLTASDFEKSAAFYDSFLGELNATRILDTQNLIAWSASPQETSLSISRRGENDPVPSGVGYLLAFGVNTPEQVNSLFNKAIALGAQVDVPVSLEDNDFYSGYVKDFDGHKLRIFCITA